MARPTNRSELLKQSQEKYEDLIALVGEMPQEQQEQEFLPTTMNRNISDVLMHLHHWHLLLLDWYQVGMNGNKPSMPAKGYTWRTLPALNQWICQHYNGVSLDQSRQSLRETHDRVTRLIENHSDDELFTKKRYSWTGSTSLGAYCISTTASHYAWAIKLIKKNLK